MVAGGNYTFFNDRHILICSFATNALLSMGQPGQVRLLAYLDKNENENDSLSKALLVRPRRSLHSKKCSFQVQNTYNSHIIFQPVGVEKFTSFPVSKDTIHRTSVPSNRI